MKFLILHGSYGSPDGNWFRWLERELKELGHEVILEQFPVDDWDKVNKIGPEEIKNYSPIESLTSWDEFFAAHILPKINDEKIGFVGHSIAPVFMLHVLSKYDLRLKTSLFVSPFFNIPNTPDVWQFYPVNKTFYSYDFDFDQLKEKVDVSHVIYSDNDPYVPISEPILFANKLGSKVHIVPNGSHLGSSFTEFPLLLDLIKQDTQP